MFKKRVEEALQNQKEDLNRTCQSNRAEVEEVEVSLDQVKNAEHFDFHIDTQDKLREISVDNNSEEQIKIQNESHKSIKLIKNRSKSLLEQSQSSQTNKHKVSKNCMASPIETQDKNMEDENEEQNIQNSDSVMKPKFKNLTKFSSKHQESKQHEKLLDDNDVMECEGGS